MSIHAGLGHSLEKFFTDSPVPRLQNLALCGLRNEVLAFQVAYRADVFGQISIALTGAAADWCTVRRVDLAHVEHPTYGCPAAQRIGTAPGFYPDPLLPDAGGRMFPLQTRAFWVTVRLPADAKAGARRLGVRVVVDGRTAVRLQVDVTVLRATLPAQTVEVIHWFHNDCLMSQYGCQAWSPEHWRIAERYLRNAVEHGVNVMTTPLFTPPLDTAVGTERPTVQLVDVTVTGKDRYQFGFDRLADWLKLCRRCGVTGFELSHLATQWGAKHVPKIVATVKGESKRIFGWDDASDGDRYRRFLQQFLPQLVAFLKQRRALDCSYLHVSDEPALDHLPQYAAVRSLLRQYAPELPVIEALSDLEFYQHGLVDVPCPATNHAQPFLDAKIDPLWCYYCCGQALDVSNRFLDFPSVRNRILGWQLFRFGFVGFLQWGYNHWYRGLTDQLIDPYTDTHAGRPLPPGDGFVVYPGADGCPVDSLRWEVFREGLQDQRALELLAGLNAERKDPKVTRLLRLSAIRSLADYPRTDAWLLRQRQAVNDAIAALTK